MGRHSRTAPLLSTSPYGVNRQETRPSQGYLGQLPSNETQRLRQDAIEDRFNQGHTRVISFTGGERAIDPGSPEAAADRSSVARTLSKTSVPLSHLNGIQFMRVIPDMLSEHTMAQYHPGHRGMDIPRVNHPDVAIRGQQVRSIVHEIGHHTENMANGRISSLGRSEAMAENYADRHLPQVPVTHAGVTVGYQPRSGYDAHSENRPSVWQQSWDPTGQQNLSRYRKTRAKGTMPYEY